MSTTKHDTIAAESASDESREAAVPPVGEEIHLPGGSVLPLAVAFGVTLLVVGTTIWWVWSALGLVVTGVSVGLWIRDTRREIAELPEEHKH